MKRKYINGILLIILGSLTITFSLFVIKRSLNNLVQEKVGYAESSNIDYKVYLKDNNFFNTPFIGPGKAYITSLIDYLDIDFRYNINLEKKMSGNYKYYIKGIASANIVNTENDYWSKEFVLSDVLTNKFSNQQSFSIGKNLKVDYQKYNEMLLEFMQQFGLTIDGKLRIYLVVDMNLDSEISPEKITKNSSTYLEIPLTKATIEVPIKLSTIDNTNTLMGGSYLDDNSMYQTMRIGGICIFILGTIIILSGVLYIVNHFERETVYAKEKNKILKTYDSIIVNSKMNISIKNYDVIDVSNFEEMIDAYGEVRQPINFSEDDEGCLFFLIKDKIIWRYIIKKED